MNNYELCSFFKRFRCYTKSYDYTYNNVHKLRKGSYLCVKYRKIVQPNPKAKQRASLTFRMNVLFFSIFVLFSVLIFRLGYLQIVKGEDYVRALERTEEVRVNTSVPRGRIFDRYGRILVDNQPENAITYTKMQTTKSR